MLAQQVRLHVQVRDGVQPPQIAQFLISFSDEKRRHPLTCSSEVALMELYICEHFIKIIIKNYSFNSNFTTIDEVE